MRKPSHYSVAETQPLLATLSVTPSVRSIPTCEIQVANSIGAVDASGYSFDSSTACINGMFVGLPLDEMNEDDQTEGRIDQWLASIRKEGIE